MRISIGHWSVEARHLVLDGAQAEDKRKLYRGSAPEVLSILWPLAGNLISMQAKLHEESAKSVMNIMKMMHMRPDYLKAILTPRPKKAGSTEV
jgi:hypothetical protein